MTCAGRSSSRRGERHRLATAKHFASQGWSSVSPTSTRQGLERALAASARTPARPMCWTSATAQAGRGVADFTKASHGRLDVLVNNGRHRQLRFLEESRSRKRTGHRREPQGRAQRRRAGWSILKKTPARG